MTAGDVIVNPYVNPTLEDGDPNPNYAMIFKKRQNDTWIDTFGIDEKSHRMYCKKAEENEWEVVGHVEISVLNLISKFIPEWAEK